MPLILEGSNLMQTYLGDGFKLFSCVSLFGEMIQFDEHIFQMGWFNHQLGMVRLGYLPFNMHCL